MSPIRSLFTNAFVIFILKLATVIIMFVASEYLFDFANDNKISGYYLWLSFAGQIVLSTIWAVLFYLLYFAIIRLQPQSKMLALTSSYIILYVLLAFIFHNREIKNFIWGKDANVLNEIPQFAIGLVLSCLIFLALYQIVGKKMITRASIFP